MTCHIHHISFTFLPAHYVAASLLPHDDHDQTLLPVRQLHFFDLKDLLPPKGQCLTCIGYYI